MHQAIPYRHAMINIRPSFDGRSAGVADLKMAQYSGGGGGEEIRKAVEENPVVVVGRKGCCMVHVVRRLLLGQGVNPTVCDVGDDVNDGALMKELPEMAVGPIAGGGGGGSPRQEQPRQMLLPAVFIGGRLVGGLDRLMAVHIAGDLVPALKKAGALWL